MWPENPHFKIKRHFGRLSPKQEDEVVKTAAELIVSFLKTPSLDELKEGKTHESND